MSQDTVKIGLVNPKSPSNVGSVMRAAGCFGASEVFYTGQRYARAARFNTDTKNQSLNIPLSGVDDLAEQATGLKIVCIELAEGATALPDFTHPEQALYIFGPEDGSISQELVDKADDVVYIPTRGCLNLAATVNVVLYDRLAKSDVSKGGDELIRQSRDVNNRLKAN
ncbi:MULTISPECIES: RNA methyltransferase [unclassified Agarivorans]|uniref:RNA methyltransferase n=1 Tax=unclassified Agarivorans TaxID=2636026 RepID=UPI0026E41BF0|nr:MULTISPECIES: RNA methyltransferase [unclassified Agarivorans]MDO6684147.1 RNA methyltransferase [Agarivorans sp. 3_MG-2023]MDO6714119.1 RNA methyltransferase [Agarivorans sp. 2_MG-2023]